MALSQEFYFYDADERPWVVEASCRDANPDLFFPGSGGDPQMALRICAGCPVQEECLDWALDSRISYGVWGGATERDRRRFFRQSA